jgi:hypothetical protein
VEGSSGGEADAQEQSGGEHKVFGCDETEKL